MITNGVGTELCRSQGTGLGIPALRIQEWGFKGGLK